MTALSSADRVPDSDSEGRGFKSLRAGQRRVAADRPRTVFCARLLLYCPRWVFIFFLCFLTVWR